MRGKRGFTLIEVLIVVIILGILATIAVPQFTGMIRRARLSEGWSALGAIKTAQEIYHLDHNAYTTSLGLLQVDTVIGNFTLTVPAAAATSYTAQATGAGNAANVIAEIRRTAAGLNQRRYSLDNGATWSPWTS
jgi:type IV pilus assembly protein PilE